MFGTYMSAGDRQAGFIVAPRAGKLDGMPAGIEADRSDCGFKQLHALGSPLSDFALAGVEYGHDRDRRTVHAVGRNRPSGLVPPLDARSLRELRNHRLNLLRPEDDPPDDPP